MVKGKWWDKSNSVLHAWSFWWCPYLDFWFSPVDVGHHYAVRRVSRPCMSTWLQQMYVGTTCWPAMTFVDSTSQWRCGLTSRDCPFFTVEVGQDFTCSVNVVAAWPTCFLVWVLGLQIAVFLLWYCRRFHVGLCCRHTADEYWMRNGRHYNRVLRCAPTVLPRMLTDLQLRFLFCSIFGCPRVIFNFSIHVI